MSELENGSRLGDLAGEEIVAAVFVPRAPENFLATIRSLAEAKIPVVLGIPDHRLLGPLSSFDGAVIETWSAATLVNDVWRETRASILAVWDAVLVPPGILEQATTWLRRDLRVSSISFLSNNAGFLSFPYRGHPVERPIEGHDEQSLTRRLRALAPPPEPTPVPLATGAAVLLSSVAIGVVGSLENPPSGRFIGALASFSCEARTRGFVDLLDPGTFYARPSDLSTDLPYAAIETGLDLEDNGWLHERHPTAHTLAVDETARVDSPLALGHNIARVKIQGLKLLVDGTCLGGQEMGTQVATVALIKALAGNPEVREVCVALPGPIPPYARATLTLPKVRSGTAVDGRPPDFGRADVGHRPFQPNEGFDVTHWRECADRVFITVHDLISYHIGSYSGDAGAWLRYRDVMRRAAKQVDAVVVDAEDVARQIELNRLGVAADRLFVVPLGTEHLNGEELACMPTELLERGFVAGRFLLCLGTNYTHKNRDLALATYAELRLRGHDLALVVAGPGVPWGSSRSREARAGIGENVYVLPDVTSEERNWLLRHASAVLYPTSAEGFGLVPYEAARFGTPTVFVPFGPLGEFGADQPVLAEDWSPPALANATEALLGDPALAARQVEACVAAGTGYSWTATAAKLAIAYRSILARPPL